MRGRLSVASMRLRGFGTRPATAVFAAIGLVLAACGSTGPPLKTYVLGAPQIADGAADPLLGRPVIEVKRALMPDYLDGTEILVRGPGNLVEASRTGRWRERLSVGATRAIANGLSRRLPDTVVATSTPPEPAACELLLDVEAFEANASQRVSFVGQWRLLAGSANTVAGERVSLNEPIIGAGDEAIVAAMNRAIDDLADRMAATIRELGSPCRRATRERAP